jgi:hypothetical protein
MPRRICFPSQLAMQLGLIFLLSACATPEAFREPGHLHSAKLRIKNTNLEEFFLAVSAADPTSCSVSGIVGWVNGGKEIDPNRVGMLESEDFKEGILERRIPADTSIAFVPQVIARLDWVTTMTVMGAAMEDSRERVRGAQSGVCSTPVFMPREGEEYELIFTPSPGSCTVKLYKLTSSSDGKVHRTDVVSSVTRWISPIPGTYIRGIPKVTCRDS